MTGSRGQSREGDSLEPEFAAWSFWETASKEARADQDRRLAELRAQGHHVGERAMVSRLAAVHPDVFSLGDRSYVAAHAHVSGAVHLGEDCSVNVGAAVRGNVTTGRAVRIGSYSALLGFNHGIESTDMDIYEQPLSSTGIVLGDDVWLGSQVIVLDGVTIGSHAVVGAGSVVTRDVPEWAVAVGNPAHVVRDRRSSREALAQQLQGFSRHARSQIRGILDRAWDGDAYRDRPDARRSVRARCDAIELAALLADHSALAKRDHGADLKRWQDRDTGLVAELGDIPARPEQGSLPDQTSAYHVLSVGYALDLLGERFPHPIGVIEGLDGAALEGVLTSLDLAGDGWSAGALMDAVGTALTWAVMAGRTRPELVDVMLGFMASRRDCDTGLIARGPTDRDAVNGTYRALRGTAARWTERRVDPVLARTVADYADSIDWSRASACDGLDVVWLLWWARGDQCIEASSRSIARTVIDRVLAAWEPHRGLPFEPAAPATLQGTEMWLATLWYASDLMGVADSLGFQPAGVHSPVPSLRWSLADRDWKTP